MMWSEDQATDFENLVVAGYSYAVTAFNEADLSTQANLDPGYAAQLWQQYVQPKAALGMKLIAPPTSSAASGKTWMQSFMGACVGCQFDSCGLHFYGTDVGQFQSYVEDWHNTFSCSIDVLEYAPMDFSGGTTDSLSDIFAFYTNANSWLDDTSYVNTYYPFGFVTDMGGVNPLDAMIGSDGTPTSLALMIINDDYSP